MLKFFSLFFSTVGIFAISFIFFCIGSGIFAWIEYPNKENVLIERILFCVLAFIQIALSVFVIPKKSGLPVIYTILNTAFIIGLYLIAGYIWLTN